MDKLEKQILENRSGLDLYNPDPGVWKRILGNLRRDKNLLVMRVSKWAAVFIILITSLLFISPGGRSILLSSGRSDNMPVELRETEIYYSNRIDNLIKEAEPILTEYPGLNQDLMSEIGSLDILYLEIKKDLKDNVSNDEVIEALILNYKARIKILEEMLDIISQDDMSNENKDRNEI